jgi:hypothetical protein
MSENCYEPTRDDGEELGTFDREDEAQTTAEYDARERGYTLSWTKYFGGMHGIPSIRGRGIVGSTIKEVDCP